MLARAIFPPGLEMAHVSPRAAVSRDLRRALSQTIKKPPSVVKDDIRLSVALVTHNRPDSLARCLTSLRDQNEQPFEVIVSDDSDAIFSAVTQEMARQFDCRWIAGPRRGLYANRNAAALACAGTHVRTMDDDHTFPAGHFDLCHAAVRSDPRAVWTTGEIGFVDGKYHSTTEKASQLCAAGVGSPVRDPDDNWAIADGSTIYPREIFDRGLRMVEAFGYGSGYLEFGVYLYAHGYRGRCVPEAVVEHFGCQETLDRGRHLEFAASCIFACICFNRFFQPSRRLLLRHLAGHLTRNSGRVHLLRRIPALMSMAAVRWRGISVGSR